MRTVLIFILLLFASCIEKWLKGQGGGKCPQCNAKAKKTDIRVIFAKTIAVVDTTERDRAIQVRCACVCMFCIFSMMLYIGTR